VQEQATSRCQRGTTLLTFARPRKTLPVHDSVRRIVHGLRGSPADEFKRTESTFQEFSKSVQTQPAIRLRSVGRLPAKLVEQSCRDSRQG